MRILVTGPRNATNEPFVRDTLTAIHAVTPITCLIEGGATGVDQFARRWAELHGVPVETCAVDHALDGPWPGAGPRRNGRMLREKRPDMGLGFVAEPATRGTADMISRMKRVGLEVTVVLGIRVAG